MPPRAAAPSGGPGPHRTGAPTTKPKPPADRVVVLGAPRGIGREPAPALRAGGGDALISVSSVESRVALPRHSACSASEHAVEGMVDALRRDLLAEGAPVSVTSITPASVNTPLLTSAAHTLEVEPTGPPPPCRPGVGSAGRTVSAGSHGPGLGFCP